MDVIILGIAVWRVVAVLGRKEVLGRMWHNRQGVLCVRFFHLVCTYAAVAVCAVVVLREVRTTHVGRIILVLL